MTWVQVGNQAVNLDHVTEAQWDAGAKKLLLVTNSVQTTTAQVSGDTTETARVFRAVEIIGGPAQELWSWFCAQGDGPGHLSLLPRGRKNGG